MAARGSRERTSQTTGQLGFGSASSIDFLEISDLAQVGANVNRPEADTICLANPGRGIYQLQFKDDNSDVSSVCSSKSEKSCGSQGPTSVSQVSGFTHESGGNVLSPTQSPSLQTMDRAGGYGESYDPFRIPSAVFQRSSSVTPLEWSIASNESLFSIQVGNNSFSRDQVLMLNELGKSGELTKSGKLKKAEDSFVFSSPPAVIMSREAEMKSAEYEADPKMADTIEYNIKDKSGSITDDDLSDRNLPPPAVSWNSSTKSRHSDRSLRSSDSFAFPILADEEAQAGSMPNDAKFQGTPVSSKSKPKCWFSCCSCSCSFSSCFKWIFCWCFYCPKWRCSYSSCYKRSCCSCSSCCKWRCSCSSCFKWNCSSCSCPKWSCSSCCSCPKWSCSSCCSCPKWSCSSCCSCPKWSCSSCCSCPKWSCSSCSCSKWSCSSCFSCSSCSKRSCSSCFSCSKWSCGSCSSCCKWDSCTCSSCWTCSCCSNCHFCDCCHFRPRCCFRPRCHIYPSCHFCSC